MSDLPQSWEWARLADVADVQGGIQKQQSRRPIRNKFPFLRVANVARGRLVLDDVHEVELFEGELARFRLESGDLLVVEGNGSPTEIGRAARWTGEIEDCVHQNHLIRVRPQAGMDPRYLELMWNSRLVSDQLRQAASTTSGLFTLNTSKIKSVRVAVAPPDEQRRITDVLDDLLSRLSFGQATVQGAAKQAQELERSLRNSHVWDAMLGTDPAKGKLRDLLDRIEAGKSFQCEPRRANDDEWGVIKVSAMTYGEFRPEENKALPSDRDVNLRHEIRPGDVLLSRANTAAYVGAPVLVSGYRGRLLLSDKSLRLHPRDQVDPQWLHLVLSSPAVRAEISARSTGTKESMRNISQTALEDVTVPLVELAEQRRRVASFNESHSEVRRLQITAREASGRFIQLREAILLAAFSGKLTSKVATDVSAAEMLASIQARRVDNTPRRAQRQAPKHSPMTAGFVQEEIQI